MYKTFGLKPKNIEKHMKTYDKTTDLSQTLMQGSKKKLSSYYHNIGDDGHNKGGFIFVHQ